jgi:type I restriction enzyme M protein
MAIKKSELYSSLWASCDELRGGMDASQYKDYVLVMLFIKYVSDKYAGQPFSPIEIPDGATFSDMILLKGKSDIGDQINKKIIEPLRDANKLTMPDFNDKVKLGEGKEMVDRLTNLISIFQKPELDFSKNRADGDDILGDAYEYLMRHFATESGKSKGQFYTPAEVSRVMASIIGIHKMETTASTSVYDPTCGSGSLLLKVATVAKTPVSLFGQEKDATTAGLAKMNMILHDNPTADTQQGNTLADPKFTKDGQLKQFDFVVANPPFSDKRWENGLQENDAPYKRFEGFGTPPSKNGDFAYLLHIVASLKRNGKGAIILPHGVLFRGNAEANIRQNLIKKGFIKGIIGLPANLFYGTGIPACIILIDKENAHTRKGIFMIDGGKGFAKDGNKNRLREQDLRKITDIFNQETEVAGFSRMVSVAEIAENDYNLNIPRYIDNQEKEDIQDIAAHLQGGIPIVDIEELSEYWQVYPNLKKALFTALRTGYMQPLVQKSNLKDTIFAHSEFVAFSSQMETLFETWQAETIAILKALTIGNKPKVIISDLSESILAKYANKTLVNKYNIYQHLMLYWNETMEDDIYLVSIDGWKAETYRILVTKAAKKKGGKSTFVDKGWACDLVPKGLIMNRYFQTELDNIANLESEKENLQTQITELEEAHNGEDGHFSDLDKITKTTVKKQLTIDTKQLLSGSEIPTSLSGKINPMDVELKEKVTIFTQYLLLQDDLAKANKNIKAAIQALDDLAYAKYPTLTEADIKMLVIDDKWMAKISEAIQGEIDHISQRLTNRIKELIVRYDTPLPTLETETKALENKVFAHLQKMGFAWK